MDREDDTEIFYYWNYDEYGNLLNVECYNTGGIGDPLHFTDFGGWYAHPAYMWTSGNINFYDVPQGDKPLSKDERAYFMKTLYLVALYGGEEGRRSVIGYYGYTITWSDIPGIFIAQTDTKNKRVQFQMGIPLSMETILHEGLHGFDALHGTDYYVDWVLKPTPPTPEFPSGGVDVHQIIPSPAGEAARGVITSRRFTIWGIKSYFSPYWYSYWYTYGRRP